jgi:hypothetical protein
MQTGGVGANQVRRASVDRMSEAISGVFAFGLIPACRYARGLQYLADSVTPDRAALHPG